MMDLLQHLIPDFAHMFSANPNGISAWFWLVTALIFGFSLFFLMLHFRHFKARMRALRSLLDGQSKDALAASRRETLHKAQELKASNVGMLWREFDESLVQSSDQQKLFNTLDAEHFFNARTLASGLTASRLLAAAPSFLVAVGVLGTFVGLTVGLEGLVGTSDEIEALKGGINKLISGAAVAFMTSVWGVAFSLLLNIIEKMFERSALIDIQKLQHDIDFLYPRIPAEQSLVHIAEYGKESKEALQELHERIGDRLQETLNGMNEAMQTALTDALNNIMAPAIQTLVSTTSQQSTQVLETLVGSFMDGMTSVGREQGSQMQQAAADVNAAVSGMSERMLAALRGMANSGRFDGLPALLRRRITARALSWLWLNDEVIGSRLLNTRLLAALLDAQQPRLTRMTLQQLAQLYFRRFDRLDEKEGVRELLERSLLQQLDLIPPSKIQTSRADPLVTLKREGHWLLGLDGPRHLAERVRQGGRELGETFMELGLHGFLFF